MVPGPVPSGEGSVSRLRSGRHGAAEGVSLIVVIVTGSAEFSRDR